MMNQGDTDSFARFLTIADTAELLNVSANQVYLLVRSGELPAIRIGGRGAWRIERTVLESFIEAKYEETRRMNLWQQADFDSVPELSLGQTRTSTTWDKGTTR
jgi:excisionase family DNA binding protein